MAQLNFALSETEEIKNSKFNGKSFHHSDAKIKPKECELCKNPFYPKSGFQKWCSVECKGKWKYVSGQVTTESQYAKISGNWKRYLNRLVNAKGRKDDGLTIKILMDKLKEQNKKCALSGEEMTCLLEKGKKFPMNASIDRIEAGGPYSPDNTRLVCSMLNKWRSDQDTDKFIEMCHKVAQCNPI